jgi:putative transposase
MMDANVTARVRARSLGVSVSTLYYKRKMPERDHALRREIEAVLREHPSYGHKRIAAHLGRNKKCILRVMKFFGIKPYRRRGRKWRKLKTENVWYPNLLRLVTPAYEGCVWAANFTHLSYRGRDVCVATVIDLYTRRIMGATVSTRHTAQIVMQALCNALLANSRPAIFHSDNGVEYNAKTFRSFVMSLGIAISRSKKGCPWENGYQKSFYNQFKIDLGDPGRFSSLGELTAAVYDALYRYNNERIHSALMMPPSRFAQLHASATMNTIV